MRNLRRGRNRCRRETMVLGRYSMGWSDRRDGIRLQNGKDRYSTRCVKNGIRLR